MTVSSIIDGIVERKNAMNMTVQQVADASGVPKSTVDNILRKTVTNPSMQNVLDIAAAVGYKFGEHTTFSEPSIQHIISMYEDRLTATSAQFNAERRNLIRTIRIIAIPLAVMVVFICGLFVYDFAHLDRGWIQEYLESYGVISQAYLAVKTWIVGWVHKTFL